MRRRFFVDRFEASSATLRGDAASHLGRVLRAEPGQLYELSDGHRVWLGRLTRVALSRRGEGRVDFALVEPIPVHEPALEIDLIPTKHAELRRPQPMPIRDEYHRRVAMPVSPAYSRAFNELPDFLDG